MRLEPGTKAPDFETKDVQGKSIHLADVPGKKWLAFFRYAGCPLCNLQVSKIVRRHADLQSKGLTVLAVFQSTAENLKRVIEGSGPPFQIVPDPEERLYALYGVETSLAGYLNPRNLATALEATAKGFLPGKVEGSKTRVPADFLIEADGTIRDAFYGRVISDHVPFERVEQFLKG